MTIGKTYARYGYPEYCGWVEGLLMLEPGDWTQQGLSKRLGEIFSSSQFPTSVPSINRALKVLESYGIVEKTGSRKVGYRYGLVTSKNLITSMLEQFMLMNQDFIMRMENLEARTTKDDPGLKRAVKIQIDGITTWNEAVEMILKKLEG
jgi:DNA-binding transcriptional regulator GbsR (MarR family)